MKKVILLIKIILLCVMIISGINICNWYLNISKNNEIYENIKEETIENIKKINENAIAQLEVKNTNINYPVVKGSDNNYYLNHSIDNKENIAGSIFMDYRNNFDGTDKNIIIYGHNMRDGSMFGSLKECLNESWYNNDQNKIITLYTDDAEYKYEVFSVYNTKSEDYYIKTDFTDEKDFDSFVKNLAKRSIHNFNNSDNVKSILTLSSCFTKGSRVVLHAKKIELT